MLGTPFRARLSGVLEPLSLPVFRTRTHSACAGAARSTESLGGIGGEWGGGNWARARMRSAGWRVPCPEQRMKTGRLVVQSPVAGFLSRLVVHLLSALPFHALFITRLLYVRLWDGHKK